jgi:RNA polymerase sigma factor (sigma-70 family)
VNTWSSSGQDGGHQARLSLASFDVFYRRYLPVLMRYLICQARDSGWAPRIAQDAMIAACDKWDDLLTYDRPDFWLFMVGTRRLRRLEARARERCWLSEDIESTDDQQIVAAIDPWVGEHRGLIAAMRSLPRRQAEAVGLHYLAGYSVPDTATILHVSEWTARTQLRRGLDALATSRSPGPAVSIAGGGQHVDH